MAETRTPAAAAVAAAVQSHRSWHAARALAAGGQVRERWGGVLTYAPDGEDGGHLQVLFVTEGGRRAAEVADEVLAWIGALPPLRDVGWWSARPDRGGLLAAALLARGFQWGWRPHWMWLDMGVRCASFPLPDGIAIAAFPGSDAPTLPAHVREFGQRHRDVTEWNPPSTTVFAAYDAEAVVGSVSVHVSPPAAPAPDGRAKARPIPAPSAPVAGVYDCWVAARARRRGIGAALTAAAAGRAQALGCRMAVLNATDMGAPMYRRVGFRSAAWGQTWWLVERQLRGPRPDAETIRFVEAIGRGDVAALDGALTALRARGTPPDLDAPLTCGETPLGVAAGLRRPAAAQRLIEHGATLDVVTAWDLGGRAAAADVLRRSPELRDRRSGEHGGTPLMTAVERDDADLVGLILAAGPDLGIRDLQWGSDALGWAEHLGRPHLAELIRAAAPQPVRRPPFRPSSAP